MKTCNCTSLLVFISKLLVQKALNFINFLIDHLTNLKLFEYNTKFHLI